MAMVHSSTDAATRASASQFLDQWTRTPEAWNIYVKWLHSFSENDNADTDATGMQLLCLTLLQAKIRREVPHGTPINETLSAVRHELSSFLTHGRGHLLTDSIASPLCICLAALVVRCGNLSDLVSMCRLTSDGNSSIQPSSHALRILACIPPEVEACSDLRTHEVTAELWPFLEPILETIRIALNYNETIAPALEALKNWSSTCHITVSHLNTPIGGGNDSLLPPLLHLLSSSHPSRPEILISASKAMTEAILIPSDSCTPSRRAATATLLNGIAHGFVAAPFAYATQHDWEDAAHALATLVCTLVTEEIDDICTTPAEACLHLLLQIQAHPRTPVTLTALECWLTVQETPASERHENWKEPLFHKITEGLLTRITYPLSFSDWDDEVDVDESEFEEIRRMVGDVLVSSYFLLRVQFVQIMVNCIMNSRNDWTLVESALFCLSKVAREVCARVKARAGGSSVSADRETTAQQLFQLVEQLCASPVASSVESAARQHPLVLSGVCNFVGAYAPTWNVKCPPEAFLHLLAYLREAMQNPTGVVIDAAKATRSIFVNCSARLLACEQQQLLTALRESLRAVLAADNEEAMKTVAEGLTRLLVQIKEESIVRESLATLVGPLLQRAEAALGAIPLNGDAAHASQEALLAVESLAKCLQVLQVVIRFLDTASPISDVIASVWPILDRTAQRVPQYEFLLDPLLSIHEQLLRNASDFVAPYFEPTMKFVVQVFETYKHPSALEYVAGAVESFGAANVDSFRNLLGHISLILFNYVSSEKRPHECPDLIRAYFEMGKRYVLYSPAALVSCQQFSTIVSMAVACLNSCHGEKESTRATLNFLTQLFGWRLLRLDQNVANSLEAASGAIDEQLAQHGGAITRSCILGLIGGPTMLWPAFSDCLFAIIHVVVSRSTPIASIDSPAEHHQIDSATIAHRWMFEAQHSCDNFPTEIYKQVVSVLTELARNGPKSKPKAKMLLTDFAKISKGEMTPDALISYSLS